MTYEQIESFLAIVTHGSISAASKELFVSQSTISNRIQQLESEIGTELIIRQKGYRRIKLTSQGMAFISIAHRWALLLKEIKTLKTAQSFQTITISSVDAINTSTFIEFFNQAIDNLPHIKLQINTHHSNEIHLLVQNRMADIGYVFSSINYPDIVSKPIFRELMYLICQKDSSYRDMIRCEELRPENEIYLNWGIDFQQWHDSHWSPSLNRLISVNTGSMLQHYLRVPERWAIAPMSVIKNAIKTNPQLTYYTLSTPPPPRICYELTHRYPTNNNIASVKEFQKALDLYIENDNAICTFEDWMLANPNT